MDIMNRAVNNTQVETTEFFWKRGTPVEKRGTLSTMLRSFTSDTLLRSGKKNWEIAFAILMQLL